MGKNVEHDEYTLFNRYYNKSQDLVCNVAGILCYEFVVGMSSAIITNSILKESEVLLPYFIGIAGLVTGSILGGICMNFAYKNYGRIKRLESELEKIVRAENKIDSEF